MVRVFHFYHMVDQSTAFETAVCAPFKDSSVSHQRQLTTGWILWAGPPSQLVLDAAGKFCDESVGEFA